MDLSSNVGKRILIRSVQGGSGVMVGICLGIELLPGGTHAVILAAGARRPWSWEGAPGTATDDLARVGPQNIGACRFPAPTEEPFYASDIHSFIPVKEKAWAQMQKVPIWTP